MPNISFLNSIKLFIIAGLLLALPAASVAQTVPADTLRYYFGPYIGYNINFHNAGFKALATDCPTCVPEEYGFNVGGGIALGGLFEYIIYKDNIRTPMRIGARLGYSDIGANFTQEEFIGNIASPQDGLPVPGNSDHHLEASIEQINFAPYFAYSFTDNLIANAGLNFGYILTKKFNQWEELTSPAGVVFLPENSTIRNQYTGQTIPDANMLQFGLLLGIGYEFPIGQYTRIQPELQYNINFNSVAEVDWYTSSLRLGLAVKFPIVDKAYIQPELHYQRDTISEPKMGISEPQIVLKDSRREMQGNDTLVIETYTKYVPQSSAINSSLGYYVMDNGQRKSVTNIVIEEFETIENFPFLPIVFFPDGSADLTQTRMQLLETANISNFKENELRQSDAMLLYRDMLNILGERMTTKSRSTITIRGYSSEVAQDLANKNIGQNRANAVKDYLVNVWKISPNRIKVEQASASTRRTPEDKSYNDVVEENRRAQIYSSDLDLLMPVVIARIEKISNPPEVYFDLNANSKAPITNYDFTIAQSNKPLRQYSGTPNQLDWKTTQVWNVMESPAPEFETPVTATLNLMDDAGGKSQSDQSLTVSQVTIKSKAVQAVDSLNVKIERYSLCLFDFDQASLTPLHTRILSDIKESSIQQGSTLSIDGYADRTGETQYNIDLAGRRCESVRQYINPAGNIQTQLESVGNQRLLYDNTTPEGRAFCRTVRIEIRTPNK